MQGLCKITGRQNLINIRKIKLKLDETNFKKAKCDGQGHC